MVTECQAKPISMDFDSLKEWEGREGGFMCGGHGAGLYWKEEKVHLEAIINLFFLQ